MDLPKPGCVHVWYLDLRTLGSPLHTGTEGQTSLEFSARQERAVRRFYLRLLLGAYLEVPGKEVLVSRQIRGKPVLDPVKHGPVLDFSVARSDGSCLIGISTGGLIGVDLELEDRQVGDPLALSRRYFSDSESAALANIPGDKRYLAFMYTWACKEAVVKAAGHGIADRLHRFSVNVHPCEPPAMLAMDDDEAERWKLALVYPGSRHIGAVAVRQEALRIECFRLQPLKVPEKA